MLGGLGRLDLCKGWHLFHLFSFERRIQSAIKLADCLLWALKRQQT
jgi:hypothetical protein